MAQNLGNNCTGKKDSKAHCPVAAGPLTAELSEVYFFDLHEYRNMGLTKAPGCKERVLGQKISLCEDRILILVYYKIHKVFFQVTNKIISMIEPGVAPWRRTWNTYGLARNYGTKH